MDDPAGFSLLFDVWVASNATRALLDRALRPSGLSAEEFAVYSAVARDGLTPTELGVLMGLPATTVSSIVNRLAARDHVTRVPNPHDARSYLIRLTPAGRRVRSDADKLFRPVLSQVQAAIGRPAADVHDVLAAITAAARQAGANQS